MLFRSLLNFLAFLDPDDRDQIRLRLPACVPVITVTIVESPFTENPDATEDHYHAHIRTLEEDSNLTWEALRIEVTGFHAAIRDSIVLWLDDSAKACFGHQYVQSSRSASTVSVSTIDILFRWASDDVPVLEREYD